ncbi:MAG: hypothetical protein RLO37_10800 [Coleofasciculus chthonoplastes F1-TOW-03]|uniref:hypothetical protein n=1 Tax=Coleofasciculus chthonoplastes TaxID=64178 RepID=UPI0032FBC2DB
MTENTTATPEKTNTHVDNGNQQQRQDSEATAEKPPQHPEADQEDLTQVIWLSYYYRLELTELNALQLHLDFE